MKHVFLLHVSGWRRGRKEGEKKRQRERERKKGVKILIAIDREIDSIGIYGSSLLVSNYFRSCIDNRG